MMDVACPFLLRHLILAQACYFIPLALGAATALIYLINVMHRGHDPASMPHQIN